MPRRAETGHWAISRALASVCEHQLGGPLPTDGGLQRIAAGDLGNEAEIREWQAHAQAVTHVDDVRCHRQRAAASYGDALHRRQQRLVEVEDRIHAGMKGAGLAIGAGRRSLADEGAEVDSGGEVAAGAGQHDDGYGGILPGVVETVRERIPLRVVECVLLLRAVERGEKHAILVELTQHEALVRHLPLSFRVRGNPRCRAVARCFLGACSQPL
jgi:hypothetical protein